jgi:hypothetical protein
MERARAFFNGCALVDRPLFLLDIDDAAAFMMQPTTP